MSLADDQTAELEAQVEVAQQGHRDGGKLILDTYSHVDPVHSYRMAQFITDSQPENVTLLKATA